MIQYASEYEAKLLLALFNGDEITCIDNSGKKAIVQIKPNETFSTRKGIHIDNAEQKLTRMVLGEFGSVKPDNGDANFIETLGGREYQRDSFKSILEEMINRVFFTGVDENGWGEDENNLFYATTVMTLAGIDEDNVKEFINAVLSAKPYTGAMPEDQETQEIISLLPGQGQGASTELDDEIRGAFLARQYYHFLKKFKVVSNSKGASSAAPRVDLIEKYLLQFVKSKITEAYKVAPQEAPQKASQEASINENVTKRKKPRVFDNILLAVYNHYINEIPMSRVDGRPVIEDWHSEKAKLAGINTNPGRIEEVIRFLIENSKNVEAAEQAVLDAMQPNEKPIDRT